MAVSLPNLRMLTLMILSTDHLLEVVAAVLANHVNLQNLHLILNPGNCRLLMPEDIDQLHALTPQFKD